MFAFGATDTPLMGIRSRLCGGHAFGFPSVRMPRVRELSGVIRKATLVNGTSESGLAGVSFHEPQKTADEYGDSMASS
jgi:hypothetical protein